MNLLKKIILAKKVPNLIKNKSFVIIGGNGVERIVEIKLNKEEQSGFNKSANAVKGLVEACIAIDGSLS